MGTTNPCHKRKILISQAVRFMVVLFFLSVCNHATAQQPFDFFWSSEDLGSGNIVNDDLVIDLLPGDSQILNLYYTTDGPAQSELGVGGGLDIQTSSSGNVAFDAGERSSSTSLLILEQGLCLLQSCLLYTSPSPRDQRGSRMPSSA